MYGELHLTADRETGRHEHIQRMTDDSLGGVLDRHHSVVATAGFDAAKHRCDIFDGNRIDGVPEMLEGGAFGEGAFRSQVCDCERLLQCPAGRHDFLEYPRYLATLQRSGIVGDEAAQHLRLAVRTVVVLAAVAVLDLGDPLGELGATAHEREQLRIEPVDLASNGFELFVRLAHGLNQPKIAYLMERAAITPSIAASFFITDSGIGSSTSASV